MDKNFICGNKYTISATNTIALPVSLENLPNEIIIGGVTMILKPSFHVSLVCINEIIRKHNVLIPNFKDLVVSDFCDFISRNSVDVLNYFDDFKFVTQNDLKTVVVTCNVSNINKFFDFLNKKYNLNIEYPPMHVTLYILEGKKGIFLTDSEDIKNLTKPISNPVGRSL